MRKKITLVFSALLILSLCSFSIAGDGCKDCEGEECTCLALKDVKLTLHGNFQSQFMMKISEDDDLGPNDQFRMYRARLLLKGEVIPDKVYLVTQFEMNAENALRDFKFIYAGLPLNTYVAFGRMKPNFTYYMPRNTAKLDFIHYPLMVQAYGMGWQMGVQTTSKISGVKINLGIFNGQHKPDNYTDTDKYKDLFFRGDYKMPVGPGKLMVGAYGWMGSTAFGDDKLTNSRYGFVGGYGFGSLDIKGEYLMATDEQAVGDDVKGNSFYVQAAYRCWEEKIGTLVRFETLDMNTDMDDDERTWTTLGVNYYMNSWKTMFYLNYMMRDNADNVVMPAVPTYMDGLNDIFMFQAQIAF
ncbi:MAG: hypothetical protein H8E46_05545 [FCB group bacterium]|nr:hypothetical protein [FCB group bacterium]